jgi:hypothetical protein
MTADTVSDPRLAAASNGIKIGWVLLLTGTVGLFVLSMSWLFAISALALLAVAFYFAIAGSAFHAAFSIAFMIFATTSWAISRWIARGLLEGRKAPTIVACILMIGFALLLALGLILEKAGSAMAGGAQALVPLVLSLLLIASFRERLYWRAR